MTTLNISVATGADDDQVDDSPANWFPDYLAVVAGKLSAESHSWGSSMRFTGVNIPAGATVTVAYLTLTPVEPGGLNGTICNTDLYCENSKNPGQMTSWSDHAGRTRTADIEWDGIPVWTEGVAVQSPSIVSIIQTVVDDQDGTGDALIVFWEDRDNRSTIVSGVPRRGAASYDHATLVPPAIHIEYFEVSPTVTTEVVTDIIGTTATGYGTISDLGDSPVTEHGFVVDTTIDPKTAGDGGSPVVETTEGAGSLGAFTSSITGLTGGTKYYARAYATNSHGTSYGANVSFVSDQSWTVMLPGFLTVNGEFICYVSATGKRRKLLGDEY